MRPTATPTLDAIRAWALTNGPTIASTQARLRDARNVPLDARGGMPRKGGVDCERKHTLTRADDKKDSREEKKDAVV